MALAAAQAAAPYYDITAEEALRGARERPAVRVRWCVAHALWMRGWTLARIGAALNQDHSTVSHALSKARRAGVGDERYAPAAHAAVQAIGAIPAWTPPTPRRVERAIQWNVPPVRGSA